MDDKSLADLLRRNDSSAWEHFYATYRQKVIRVARRMLQRGESVAEDVVDDFVERKLRTYPSTLLNQVADGAWGFEALLFIALRNFVRDIKRKRVVQSLDDENAPPLKIHGQTRPPKLDLELEPAPWTSPRGDLGRKVDDAFRAQLRVIRENAPQSTEIARATLLLDLRVEAATVLRRDALKNDDVEPVSTRVATLLPWRADEASLALRRGGPQLISIWGALATQVVDDLAQRLDDNAIARLAGVSAASIHARRSRARRALGALGAPARAAFPHWFASSEPRSR